MSEKPVILRSETIARTRVFHIEELELRFANGREVVYERLRGSARGAVLIVPFLDPDTLLLAREYAAGSERYELAFPKGLVEAGETPEQAANRELMEELGYGARRLRHFTTLSLAPAYQDHVTHVVLAEDLYEQQLSGDEPEAIEAVRWRLDDLPALLAREDFSEARSIAALYLAQQERERRMTA